MICTVVLYITCCIASVDDYSPTKLTTTITPGSTNTTVMFVITDDDMLESEEIFEILLIVPKDMAILLGNITTLTLTVIDNDGQFHRSEYNKMIIHFFRNFSVIFKS